MSICNGFFKEGKLGKISSAHAHYGHLGPTWSAFFYEKGGGSLPDLGVYNLATLTGLLGPARSVTAMTTIVTPTRKTDNKGEIRVEAENNAMVLMDHEFSCNQNLSGRWCDAIAIRSCVLPIMRNKFTKST